MVAMAIDKTIGIQPIVSMMGFEIERVGPMGFEPMTLRLKGECSTPELRTHFNQPSESFCWDDGDDTKFRAGKIII